MTGDPTADAVLMEDLLHHGARLAGTIRDHGPDAIAPLLDPANVPGGRLDLLALALAGMVDPDRPVSELVAWSLPGAPPLRSRSRAGGARPGAGRPRLPREHGTERGWGQHRTHADPPCPDCRAAHKVTGRPRVCRDEFARLVAQGVAPTEAADLSTLTALLAAHTRRDAA